MRAEARIYRTFITKWVSLVVQLVKNPPAMLETWVWSWPGKIPWRRERLSTPVFWPGEFHGLYSPWVRKELDTTERISLSLFLSVQNSFNTWSLTHRFRKLTYGCQAAGIVRDFGKAIYTLLYLKWVTNKDLLNSPWNSTQCYVPAWMGGEFGGEWIHVYVYVWLSPFAVHRNYHNIVNWLYPSTKQNI